MLSRGSIARSFAGPVPLGGPSPPTSQCLGVWSSLGQADYVGDCSGHDQPGLQFYSNLPGSGGNVTWTVSLPVDASPTQNQSDLYAAVWFGVALTSPTAWMGQCFLELQLYPDFSFYVNTTLHPAATWNGVWSGAAWAWQIDRATGLESPCFYQPLYASGVPGPDYLNMSQGDTLRIAMTGWAGSPYGENVSVVDVTNGNRSQVRAFNATSGVPLDPAYPTSTVEQALPWSTGGAAPVTFGFENGRAGNPAYPNNNTFGGCSPGLPPSSPKDRAVPCPSYDPLSWINDTQVPWHISAPVFGSGTTTQSPAQVGITQNQGGSLLLYQFIRGACDGRVGSSYCSYPWFSYACNVRAFEFGATDYNGVTSDFGKDGQYSATNETGAAQLATYFAATNFTIPTCGQNPSSLTLSSANPTRGSVYFLSRAYYGPSTQTQLSSGPYALHAVANPGAMFLGWVVNGSARVDDTAAAWTTLTTSGTGSLSAVFTTTGGLTHVRLAGSLAGTAVTGTVDVTQGLLFGNLTPFTSSASVVQLNLSSGAYGIQAYPPPGYRFTAWTVSGGSGDVAALTFPTTTLFVDAGGSPLTVTAQYAATLQNATVALLGIGNGNVTFGAKVATYDPLTHLARAKTTVRVGTYSITASPARGWSFLAWVPGPMGVQTDFRPRANLTVENGSTTLIAEFAVNVSVRVTPATAGKVAIDGLLPVGNATTVALLPGTYNLDAVPGPGELLSHWNVSNRSALWAMKPTLAETKLVVNDTGTLTANFTNRSTVSLTFANAPAAGGTIIFNFLNNYSGTVTNSSVVNGTYVVRAQSIYGYRFLQWNLTGPISLVGQVLTVRGTGGVLTAQYVLRYFPVTFIAIPSGASSAILNGTLLRPGDSVGLALGTYNLSAVPNPGSSFSGWSSTLPIGSTSSNNTTLGVIGAGTVGAITIPFRILGITPSPATVDVGVRFQLSTQTQGSGPFTYVYHGLPAGCPSVSSATLNCTTTTAGVYRVSVTVNNSAGVSLNSGQNSVTVNAPPSVTSFAPALGAVDVGDTAHLTAVVTDGTRPGTFSYVGLPTGCASANTTALSCAPSSAGTATVEFEYRDLFGLAAFANTSLTVNALPSVGTALASPAVVTVGVQLAVRVSPAGGTAPFTFAYSALPGGCATANTPVLNCTPSAAGSVNISATVTDARGHSASALVPLLVNGAPTIALFSAYPPALATGQALTLSVTASGGTGTLHYSYAGLPGGCPSSNTSILSCNPSVSGTYAVTVTVADRFNVSASATTSVTVAPGSSVNPGGQKGPDYLLIGLVAALIAAVALLIYLALRKSPPAPPKKVAPTPTAPPPAPKMWTEDAEAIPGRP